MLTINIREIKEADYPMLPEFLYQAIFVPPDSISPPKKVIYEPNIFIYIENFGGKDDCGDVAECNDKILGAA